MPAETHPKTDALLVERDGAVETLVINDAPRNRMSLDFMDALEAEVERIAEERRAVLATMGTADQREGIQAFLEKRRPRFNRDAG